MKTRGQAGSGTAFSAVIGSTANGICSDGQSPRWRVADVAGKGR